MAKSPLAQAFGLALQKRRTLFGLDSEKIADQLAGMSVTYYKAIEAGTYNLNVGNSKDLCKAFDNENYSLYLPGVIHLLGVISILEIATKELKDTGGEEYAEAYYAKFVEITKDLVDPKMKFVRQKFETAGIFELLKSQPSNIIKDVILDNKLHFLIEDFITYSYEKIGSERAEISAQFAQDFFEDFPTVFKDFLDSFKSGLQKLSKKYDYRSASEWESEHTDKIVRVIGITTEKSFFFKRLKSRKYYYNYFAGSSFRDASFIFLNSSENSEELKSEFEGELLNARCDGLSENDEVKKSEIREIIAAQMEKVHFKIVNDSPTFNIENTLTRLERNNKFNTFWIFELTDGFFCGVKASITSGADFLLREGEYLTFGESKRLLDVFNNLWPQEDPCLD